MKSDAFAEDLVTRALASLSACEPERQWSEHTRARCRRAMLRRQTQEDPVHVASPSSRRILETALVAGVSVAFLVDVVRLALRLYGF